MWEEIPSEPVAIFGFSERIRGVTSSIVNRILESHSFVKYERMGKILLFRTSEHCRQKNWVNNVAFSRQFKINLLSTRRGGVFGTLHLFITLFRILKVTITGKFCATGLTFSINGPLRKSHYRYLTFPSPEVYLRD